MTDVTLICDLPCRKVGLWPNMHRHDRRADLDLSPN